MSSPVDRTRELSQPLASGLAATQVVANNDYYSLDARKPKEDVGASEDDEDDRDGLDGELGLWDASAPPLAIDPIVRASAPAPVIEALEAAVKATAVEQTRAAPSGAFVYKLDDAPHDDDDGDGAGAGELLRAVAGVEEEEKKAAVNRPLVFVPNEAAGEGEGEGEGAPVAAPPALEHAVSYSIAYDAEPAEPPLSLVVSPAEHAQEEKSLKAPLPSQALHIKRASVARSRSHIPDDEALALQPNPLLVPNAAAAPRPSLSSGSGPLYHAPAKVVVDHRGSISVIPEPPPDLPPPSFDEAVNSPPLAAYGHALHEEQQQQQQLYQEHKAIEEEMPLNMNPLLADGHGEFGEPDPEYPHHLDQGEHEHKLSPPLVYSGAGQLSRLSVGAPDIRSIDDEAGQHFRIEPSRRQLEGRSARTKSRAEFKDLGEDEEAMLAQFDQRVRSAAGQKKTKRPYVTYILGIVFILFFVWPLYSNNWSLESQYINPMIGPSLDKLVALGAKDTYRLVVDSQYWRLLSSCILNAGILQLVMNLIAVMQNCASLEYEYGSLAVLSVFVVSGVAGQLLSCAVNPLMIAVGSSGAVSGFSGALVCEYLYYPDKVEESGNKWKKRWYLIKILLNFIIALAVGFVPLIDNWAILGGFLAGFCTACAAFYTGPRTPAGDEEAARGGGVNAGPADEEKRRANSRLKIMAVSVFLLAGGVFLGGGQVFYSKSVDNWCSTCSKFGCYESVYWDCNTMDGLCGVGMIC